MLTLPTKPLKAALPLFASSKSCTLPILRCVRVTTHTFGTRTTITATDLDNTVERTFDHERQPTGDFLITKADLNTLVRACKDPTVRVFPMTPAEPLKQWPKLDVPFTTHAALPFDTALARTAMLASSTDATRFVLNGIALTGTEVIGTDGRRLIHACSPFDCSAWNAENSTMFILRNDKVVQKWLGHAPPIVTACLDNERKFLRFRAEDGSCTLTTRLIEGNFPNYKIILRDKHLVNITLNADELRRAIERLPDLPDQSLRFTFRHGTTTVAVAGPEAGEFFEPVASQFDCNRKPAQIAFDRSYVLDACATGFTRIGYVDDQSPAVFDSPNVTYVLMPMRGEWPERLVDNDPYRLQHHAIPVAA